MAPKKRERPKELARKLTQIRQSLGMSQSEMWRALELDDAFTYHVISHYETGLQEPSILVLLKYARLSGITMELLADDSLVLPKTVTKKRSL